MNNWLSDSDKTGLCWRFPEACNPEKLLSVTVEKDADLLSSATAPWLVMCASNVNHVQIF